MMVNEHSQGGRPLLPDLPVGILKNITSYLAAPTSGAHTKVGVNNDFGERGALFLI
jgi:hypothetical protein